MNTLKRYAGILWMLIGPVAIYYLIATAKHEIVHKPGIETMIQWAIFVIIFIPIAIGITIFGFFALKGEYDRLPERSDEIDQ